MKVATFQKMRQKATKVIVIAILEITGANLTQIASEILINFINYIFFFLPH